MIAFEPSPRELARLHQNVALNASLPIIVMPYACGVNEGESLMYQASSDNTGANSMVQEPASDSHQTITIRTIVPGSLLGSRVLEEVRLVKIDVEGYEQFVLEGLSDSMRLLKKSVFILEINPPCLERAGSSVAAIYSYFGRNGFSGLLGQGTTRTDEDGKYDEVFLHAETHRNSDLQEKLQSLLN